ncbi:hypothetical protein BGS1_01845 [Clostridium beijerinckii]|nr:hypothetical protein BGS1_01845 [Clostridium beijerinckii]
MKLPTLLLKSVTPEGQTTLIKKAIMEIIAMNIKTRVCVIKTGLMFLTTFACLKKTLRSKA